MKRILVAISGGVDSSVAALLLKKNGWLVEGVHFILSADPNSPALKEIGDQLGIKIHILDIRKEFKRRVVSVVTQKYQKGETPNPCVICNPQIKFKKLIEFADSIGIENVATGHYTKKERVGFVINGKKIDEWFISRADDERKDQSYFLSRLHPAFIEKCEFPLGIYSKPEVREMALKEGLSTAHAEESQGLCFVEKSIEEIFRSCRKKFAGNIVDLKGNVLGRHEGLEKYTIGQRKGIKVGGSGPYFVVGKNYGSNELVVSNVGDEPLLFRDEVAVDLSPWKKERRFSFFADRFLEARQEPFLLKLRYGQPAVEIEHGKIDPQGIIKVKLKRKIRAVTLGQEAVFYDKKGHVWLGGEIKR